MGRTINDNQRLGRLGKDPELRYTGDGKAVCSFSVATGGDKWADQSGQEHVTETEWTQCVAWEGLAEIASKYLSKGSQVFVKGPAKTRSWEDDKGVKRYTTELVVKELVLCGSNGDSNGGGNRPPHPSESGLQSSKPMPAAPKTTGKQAVSVDPDDVPFPS